MQGWIKLHRCLLDKPIFENAKLLKVFLWCLCKATHTEHKQLVGRKMVKLEPGQFITGRNKAGQELNIKPSTAWDYLNLLKDNESINICSNSKYSVITVINWELYQSVNNNSDSKTDNKSTANQQQINTNKNVKNVKNEKKELIEQFEELWNKYPNRKGKQKAMEKFMKLIKEYSLEELTRAVNRYAKEVKGKDKKYIQHGSTFFNGTYVDYLDENYNPKNNQDEEEVPLFWRKERKFSSTHTSEEENDYQDINTSGKTEEELWQEADEALQNLYKKKGIN